MRRTGDGGWAGACPVGRPGQPRVCSPGSALRGGEGGADGGKGRQVLGGAGLVGVGAQRRQDGGACPGDGQLAAAGSQVDGEPGQGGGGGGVEVEDCLGVQDHVPQLGLTFGGQ